MQCFQMHHKWRLPISAAIKVASIETWRHPNICFSKFLKIRCSLAHYEQEINPKKKNLKSPACENLELKHNSVLLTCYYESKSLTVPITAAPETPPRIDPLLPDLASASKKPLWLKIKQK